MGKKIYKTSMLNIFRLIVLAIVIFFINDLYLSSLTHEKFLLESRFRIMDVFSYHYRYPSGLITFFFLIIVPAIYYAFIRGVRFYEKGFVFNHGIPFLNRKISYDEVNSYKLLHPKYAISLFTKSNEVFVIADDDMQRVIAILDQHNIPGDFARDDYAKLITNYRTFIFVVLGFTTLLFILKKLGLFLP
jgi:hypothetical protein